MRKFTIISLVIAAAFFGLGIILIIIGAINDADVSKIWKNHDFSLHNGDIFEENFDDTYDENKFTEVLSGKEGDINSLDVEIASGSLVIKKSSDDTFRVVCSDDSEVSCRLEDGVLKLEEDSKNNKLKILHLGILDNTYTKTIIYLPEKKMNSMNIVMDAGCVKLYGCEAESFEIEMKAGAFYAVETQKFDIFKADLEAGDMEMDQLYADSGEITCQVGNFQMLGGVLKSADINCELGDVSVTLFGKEQDYGFDLNVEMGNVDIGDNSYSGLDTKRGVDGKNEVKIHCEMGNVTVDFEE